MAVAITLPNEASVKQPSSIMIACLQKIDTIVAHNIDDAMFLRQASRPRAGSKVFQRLGLADTGEGITHNGFDELKSTKGNLAVGFHPITQIFTELRLKNSISGAGSWKLGFTFFAQVPSRGEASLWFAALLFGLWRDSGRPKGVWHFGAIVTGALFRQGLRAPTRKSRQHPRSRAD